MVLQFRPFPLGKILERLIIIKNALGIIQTKLEHGRDPRKNLPKINVIMPTTSPIT